MKMNTIAFEARQHRMQVATQVSANLSALYEKRNALFALPPKKREENPHQVVQQIHALATAGVMSMTEFAVTSEDLTEGDLLWICRKMLNFVRQGGWDALNDAERVLRESWQKLGKPIPSDLAGALVQVKTARNAHEAAKRPPVVPQNTIHPGGRRETAEEKKARIARRNERRALLLAGQTPKGKSPPPPNGFKNPGGKKEKTRRR